MKLGMITSPDRAGLDRLKSFGLNHAELDLNVGFNTEEFCARLAQMKKDMKETDVEISAIGRWGSSKIDEDGKVIEEEFNTCKNLVDACAELGAPVYITGCNKIEELSLFRNYSAAIEFFGRLTEYGTKKGIKIAVYNCDWNNFIYSETEWDVVLDEVKDLGIKFDPSHCIYRGGDYLRTMNDYADKFYHIHAKGVLPIDGKRVDDPPAGLDCINWPAFIALLYAKGYTETLSLEPHSFIWLNEMGEAGIRYSVEYLKKLLIY